MEKAGGHALDSLRPNGVVGLDGEPGYTSVEICAGAGGQAYGVELSGFRHLRLVEYDAWCCKTLENRRAWKNAVVKLDLHEWSARPFLGRVDLFAGGVPCPPFSRAGLKLGRDDERDLFPKAIELIQQCQPRAIMLENVRGITSDHFADYRAEVIEAPLTEAGYWFDWRLINASDFGVPQLRPRAILVALKNEIATDFEWPQGNPAATKTVGQTLEKLMSENGWRGAARWASGADRIAPTLVGGSKKHGGPDLGPTQAKKQWRELGVDAMGLADDPPSPSWNGEPPKLTVKMAAVLQGFPADWPFEGRKTNAYRQVGNAFPPPVAHAVSKQIWNALAAYDSRCRHGSEAEAQAPAHSLIQDVLPARLAA
jgi:DNA (cytosine-5)-methyltransferase 1